MSANQFAAQMQLGQLNQAALHQANVWHQGCLCQGQLGSSVQCPLHGAIAQGQAASQFQYDKSRGLYNQPFAQFTPISEDDTMDRNPADRATALECLRLAITSPCNDSIIATAEHFYSFVTGQPTASVADAVVEAVKDAVKAK